MFYALLNSYSDCETVTSIAWGKTLKEIADQIIYECKNIIDSFGDPIEELEDEYYCCIDLYKKLVYYQTPTFEMIKEFSFTISDCSVDVVGLVEEYSKLVEVFEEFSEGKYPLEEWSLPSKIDESGDDISKLNDELTSICYDSYDGDSLELLVYKNFDEDLDEDEDLD